MAGAPLAQQSSGLRAWLLSAEPHSRLQARLGRFYLGWRSFAKNPLAVLGLCIVVLLILVAIFADVIAPYSPVAGGDLRTQRLLPPSETYWFGTDDQARDIFSRVVYGSRITLMVVVLVALIATPIGLLVGTVSGYLGGWVDTVLMRITDIFLAFPRLILALAFVAALGQESRMRSSPSRSPPGRPTPASRAPRR